MLTSSLEVQMRYRLVVRPFSYFQSHWHCFSKQCNFHSVVRKLIFCFYMFKFWRGKLLSRRCFI